MRLLGGLGFICIIVLFGVAYFFYGLQPVSSEVGEQGTQRSPEPIVFKISKGEGFRDIAGRLSRSSLIKSIAVFKTYAFLTGRAQRFQPGVYELSPAFSVPEIMNLLTAGGKNEITVTVPEGSTVKDIASMLAAAGVVSDESLATSSPDALADRYPFLKGQTSFEGFLFPDTYRFHPGSSNEAALSVFLDAFQSKAWPLLEPHEGWYTMLTLASLLEREVPEFADRQVVAGILLKRLARKMPLQIDATVSYAKCGGEMRGCTSLIVTKSDLTFSSPYNTYQRLGFPPTPISNPGVLAIQAALTPTASPYLYYLTASATKETIFSKTLEEHNRNRVRYL